MRRIPLAFAALLLAVGTADAQKPRSGALLPGGNSGKPVNIEAVKLDYFDKEQKLIYTGNVIVTQGDSKLKASVLTISLAPKSVGASGAPSTNQVQHMVAAGPVTLVQRDQIGTGDNGVYDRTLNTVVLAGNVTLSQGPNVTKGDRLTYDLKTGRAVVSGRVMSMFLPGGDSGADAGAGGSEDAPRKRSRGGSASAAAGSRGM